MDRKLTHQLSSPDPKIRKQVIRELAKTTDKTALNALAVLYKGDPDEEVRQMALIAGRHIRRNMENGNAPDAPPVEDDIPEPPTESLDEPAKVRPVPPPTREAENRAKSYLNEALSNHMRGEKAKALKSMSKALQLNPGLEHDHYFRSVLDNITGLDGADSLNVIRDKNELNNVQRAVKQDKKKQQVESHRGEVEKIDWMGAGFDLSIYGIIMAVGFILSLLILQQMAQSLMAGLSDGTLVDVDPEFALVYGPFAEISFVPVLILGLAVGISSVVGLVIQSGVVHVVARYVFGGVGSLPFLLHRMASLYNVRMPILYLIVFLGIFLTFNMGSPVVASITFGAAGLYNLIISLQIVGRVGEAYHFGFLKGCLSLTAAGVVLGILSTVIQFTLADGLMQMLMPGTTPAF